METIYVVLSQTATRVGRVVRAVTNCDYNHAAIAFDAGLQEMYAFARPSYSSPAFARLVRETTGSLTRNGFISMPVTVVALRATKDEVGALKSELLRIATSGCYLYNFPSALTFPLLHGVRGDRMFTCSEFVANCLKFLGAEEEACGIPFDLPQRCTPSDLYDVLQDYIVFEGPLCEYAEIEPAPVTYFDKVTPYIIGASAVTLGVIAARTARSLFKSVKRP